MHSKSDDKQIMVGNDTYESIEERFQLLVHSYQIFLEELMRFSEYVFSHDDGLHCKCNVTSNQVRSNRDPPD